MIKLTRQQNTIKSKTVITKMQSLLINKSNTIIPRIKDKQYINILIPTTTSIIKFLLEILNRINEKEVELFSREIIEILEVEYPKYCFFNEFVLSLLKLDELDLNRNQIIFIQKIIYRYLVIYYLNLKDHSNTINSLIELIVIKSNLFKVEFVNYIFSLCFDFEEDMFIKFSLFYNNLSKIIEIVMKIIISIEDGLVDSINSNNILINSIDEENTFGFNSEAQLLLLKNFISKLTYTYHEIYKNKTSQSSMIEISKEIKEHIKQSIIHISNTNDSLETTNKNLIKSDFKAFLKNKRIIEKERYMNYKNKSKVKFNSKIHKVIIYSKRHRISRREIKEYIIPENINLKSILKNSQRKICTQHINLAKIDKKESISPVSVSTHSTSSKCNRILI